jgi:hypothetical protein
MVRETVDGGDGCVCVFVFVFVNDVIYSQSAELVSNPSVPCVRKKRYGLQRADNGSNTAQHRTATLKIQRPKNKQSKTTFHHD